MKPRMSRKSCVAESGGGCQYGHIYNLVLTARYGSCEHAGYGSQRWQAGERPKSAMGTHKLPLVCVSKRRHHS